MIHRVAVFGQSSVIDVDPPRCRTRNKNKWHKRSQSTQCPIVCDPIVRCHDDIVDYFDMHSVDRRRTIVIDSLHHCRSFRRRLWAHRWDIFAPASSIFSWPPLRPWAATTMASYHNILRRPGRRWGVRFHRCTSAASYSNAKAHHVHQRNEWILPELTTINPIVTCPAIWVPKKNKSETEVLNQLLCLECESQRK